MYRTWVGTASNEWLDNYISIICTYLTTQVEFHWLVRSSLLRVFENPRSESDGRDENERTNKQLSRTLQPSSCRLLPTTWARGTSNLDCNENVQQCIGVSHIFLGQHQLAVPNFSLTFSSHGPTVFGYCCGL